MLRLDGDLYESTMDVLSNLYPQLSPGGWLIIDDFSIPACEQAVHDYRAANGITEPIEVIDGDGICWEEGGAEGARAVRAVLQAVGPQHRRPEASGRAGDQQEAVGLASAIFFTAFSMPRGAPWRRSGMPHLHGQLQRVDRRDRVAGGRNELGERGPGEEPQVRAVHDPEVGVLEGAR